MKFWYIAWKDLKIRFKDLGATVFLFMVPILIISVTSVALSGAGDVQAMKVSLVNLDDGAISRQVVEAFKKIKALDVVDTYSVGEKRVKMTEDEARRRIGRGENSAALLIPKGFTKNIESGKSSKLVLLRDPGSQVAPSIVEGIARGFADRISGQSIAVQVATGLVMSATGGKADPRKVSGQASGIAQQAWDKAPVGLKTQDVKVIKGKQMDALKQSVPGYAVMFSLFTMLYGGSALLEEKKNGTYRRLLSSPISKKTILFGKLLPNVIISLLQITIFFAFGSFVFGMELGNSITALFTISLAVALAVTSMSILMASIVKTDAQLSGFSVLIVLLMSSLGGSWWPLEIVPPFMRTLAHAVTINAWALDGFKGVLWYGEGVAGVMPEVGALLLFSAVVFTVGLWRFKFE